MTVTRDAVLSALARIEVPGGGTLGSRDLVRALTIDGATVRFVLE
ncbi:MAG: iron-sulfur cluster assembly protein, partial [Albidovulum sp.]